MEFGANSRRSSRTPQNPGSRCPRRKNLRFPTHVYNRAVDCGFPPMHVHERPSMREPMYIASAAMSLLLAATATMAAPPPTVIIACYNVQNGRARIVSSSAACTQNESFVVWNIRGPAGPQGPTGPQGAAGSQGVQGPRVRPVLPARPELLAPPVPRELPVLPAPSARLVLPAPPAPLARLVPPAPRARPVLREPFRRISPHSPTTSAQTGFVLGGGNPSGCRLTTRTLGDVFLSVNGYAAGGNSSRGWTHPAH